MRNSNKQLRSTAIYIASAAMGNSSSCSAFKETIQGYHFGFKSKRNVAGQYTEHKDFTFLNDRLAKIPQNTRYEFAAYDFATKKVLLLDIDHLPRCLISPSLLSPFEVYLAAVAAGKLKEASASALIEEKSEVTVASAPVQHGFPDVVKPNNEVNVVAPPPYK